MSENTATQKHIESIVNAYNSSIDRQEALHVYGVIVQDYHGSMGAIEETIKKEATDSLVREKINRIKSASPQEKLLIWKQDTALSKIIPLNRSALEMASHVKNGEQLSPDRKYAASAGIDTLNLVSREIQDLPDEARTSLGDMISESLLDFSYARDPASSPQSFRLSH